MEAYNVSHSVWDKQAVCGQKLCLLFVSNCFENSDDTLFHVRLLAHKIS